jgi:non-specific serine/threonine protein kinase
LTIYGADVHDGRAGFWTDLVTGRTIEARIRAEGPAASDEATRIGLQLCRALAAVHAAGMIHGDVTAANAMEDETGTILLMDFGAVTERSHGGQDLDTGMPATPVVGTPLVMAPELLRGGTPTPSSDLYSLAVLMFRLVSGHYPVEAATFAELLDRHDRGGRKRARDAAPTLPEWLANVIDRALAADPRDRYGSALELERALAGSQPSPNNLPAPITSFVGREEICMETAARLSTARLVTLTGAGGCGKTRLAIAVAGRISAEHPGGVWMVELASIADPALVPFEAARVLGVREITGRDIQGGLVERLRGDRTLLVLDNCEQVVAGCSRLVEDLLRAIPTLRILATSREPLRIAGEAIVPVPPLLVPEAGDLAAMTAESVHLFVERARSVRHDFNLTAENGLSVIEICRRLDGIPLAIELAAARLRYFSVQEVARRLDDRFRFLTRGDRTTHLRHQTLEALIDWSYEHLDPVEQTALRRQAVFAGGWTLEAAEAVCSGDGLDEGDILDLLTRLVDRSLIEATVDSTSGAMRYRMLETIQTYARDRLTAAERQAVLERHRAHFLRLAEASAELLRGPDQPIGLSRLESDLDNLVLAMTPVQPSSGEAGSADATEASVRIAGALGRFWSIRGHWSLGAAACARLLAERRPDQRTAAWANLLNTASVIAMDQARYDDVKVLCTESLEIFREIGDVRHEAASLNNLGLAAMWQGAFEEAELLWGQALSINRRVGNRTWESTNLQNLGLAAYSQKRLADARAYLEAGLALGRELGDTHVIAGVLDNLGNLADEEGRLEEAKQFYLESLALRRRIGDRPEMAISLGNLGCLMRKLGDRDRAWALAKESLEIKRELGNVHGTTFALEAISSLAVDGGRYERAVRLLGAADAIRESIRTPRAPVESAAVAADLDRARSALGEETFRSAYAAGRGLSVEAATEEALHDGP